MLTFNDTYFEKGMSIKMKKWLQKYKGLAAGGTAAVFFALAVAAVHDMQTAEGVGLYFALKLGRGRELFDVAVDTLSALGLLALVYLPCLFLKHRSLSSLLRFLLIFLSFMPTLSLAYLLRPLQAAGETFPRQPIAILGMVLPFLCLLAMAVAWKEKAWKNWYSACCVAAVLLFSVTLFVPSLQQLFYFILVYLLLLVCFDICERLYLQHPTLNAWGMILFGGLAFRAYYVLSEILRRY